MKYLFLISVLAAAMFPTRNPEPTPSQKIQTETLAPSLPAISYVGVWSLVDEQGQSFDIVVFPNGQAVSTWTKGSSGARGERGFWRVDNRELVIFFSDGWTDRIIPAADAFIHRGFAPNTVTSKNESPAVRIEDNISKFVGVWRLNKEPDGNYLYVALQSCGRAFSSIAGGTEGKWESTPEGALCSWPDGWTDLIFTTPTGYQKRSWIGVAQQSTTPSDISEATRVGETKFNIIP